MNTLTVTFVFATLLCSGFCSPRLRRDSDDGDWTIVVTDLVRNLTAELLEKEGNYIDVDDFSDTFGGKLLDGKLYATGGYIGNFSTLRFVNLSVSTTEDSLTVFVQVQLDQLEITYSKFDASVRILSVSGGFNAVVASNLLTAQVTLTLSDDDDCSASLDILELSEFGEIDLKLTGIDLINEKFVNKIANMVVNKFTPELKPLAEGKVREVIMPYVALACDYWEE